MSKKLIAVASAAALALTALVGIAPASASSTITYDGAASGAGLTAAAPIVINVPSQNVLRNAEGAAATTSGSVIRVDIVSANTSSTIRVSATGAVKLLTAAQFSVTANRTSAFGAQALELTSSATGTAGFYVYTTSTAVGTFSVVDAGNTIVRHIQGANNVAYAYNVDFTAPTTADVSGSIVLSGSITDIFGNKIEGLTASAGNVPTTLQVTRFGAAGANATTTAGSWTESLTTKGNYTFAVTTSATAGAGIVGLTIAPVAITGFVPKNTAFIQFNTASLATQVTALTKQVTDLQAQLAALTASTVTKAKYNKLVRKWNRANPNNKVARVN
jgi:hypothetical protein